MSAILIKLTIIAFTASFGAMLSITPKGFKGTIPFLKQFYPSKKKEWYFRVNFFLLVGIGTFLGYLLSNPESMKDCVITGLTWIGSLQAVFYKASQDDNKEENGN